MYIVFVADAEVVVSWQEETESYYIMGREMPPRLRMPILMQEDEEYGMVVNVTRPPSLAVIEGDELEVQPAIRLTSKMSGRPVVGVGCVTLLIGKDEDVFPKGYRTTLEGTNGLLKP